jgi:YggT family protein
MQTFLQAYDAALAMLRTALFGMAAVLGVLCATDWMVRTRKLPPFGAVARFMRARVDPLLRPIERRVVRAGGLPSSAPWWALAAVALTGIVLLSLLGFARSQVAFVYASLTSGPTAMIRLLIVWVFTIVQIALIVRVVLSWIPMRPGAWYGRWSYAVTEPILGPLRRIIPTIGMMDVTPIVAWLLLGLAQGIVLRLV